MTAQDIHKFDASSFAILTEHGELLRDTSDQTDGASLALNEDFEVWEGVEAAANAGDENRRVVAFRARILEYRHVSEYGEYHVTYTDRVEDTSHFHAYSDEGEPAKRRKLDSQSEEYEEEDCASDHSGSQSQEHTEGNSVSGHSEEETV